MAPATLALLLLAAAPAKAPKKSPPPAAEPAKPAPEDDREPPTVFHTPIKEAQREQELRFDAEIVDASGVFEPVVDWRLAGESAWKTVPLNKGKGDTFFAALSSYFVTGDIEYFIECYDTQGNGPSRSGAPQKPFLIKVQGGAPAAQAAVSPAAAVAPAPAPAASVQVVGESGGGIGLGPLLTLGAGAVLAAAGAVMWFGASSDAKAINDKYAAGASLKPEDQKKAVEVTGQSRLGSILMISGAVAGAGGVAWWAIQPAPLHAVVLGLKWELEY